MAGDREKILDKLKKLQAHADSAAKIGSEAEAQAFAAMVQKMIAQHNIDKAELTAEDREAEDIANPIEQVRVVGIRVRKVRVAWLEALASAVAYAHFCEIGITRHSSQVWFIGRRTQAEMGAKVYVQLAEAAEAIADKEYVKHFHACRKAGRVEAARGFRPSFLDGFTSRLAKRYHMLMAELEAEAARKQGAMVLFKDERAQVTDFVNAVFDGSHLEVKALTQLDPRWDLTHRPTVRKAWQQGARWALLRGKKTPVLVSLHMTNLDASRAFEKERMPDARRNTKHHGDGYKAGFRAADALDLGVARADQQSALKP